MAHSNILNLHRNCKSTASDRTHFENCGDCSEKRSRMIILPMGGPVTNAFTRSRFQNPPSFTKSQACITVISVNARKKIKCKISRDREVFFYPRNPGLEFGRSRCSRLLLEHTPQSCWISCRNGLENVRAHPGQSPQVVWK